MDPETKRNVAFGVGIVFIIIVVILYTGDSDSDTLPTMITPQPTMITPQPTIITPQPTMVEEPQPTMMEPPETGNEPNGPMGDEINIPPPTPPPIPDWSIILHNGRHHVYLKGSECLGLLPIREDVHYKNVFTKWTPEQLDTIPACPSALFDNEQVLHDGKYYTYRRGDHCLSKSPYYDANPQLANVNKTWTNKQLSFIPVCKVSIPAITPEQHALSDNEQVLHDGKYYTYRKGGNCLSKSPDYDANPHLVNINNTWTDDQLSAIPVCT